MAAGAYFEGSAEECLSRFVQIFGRSAEFKKVNEISSQGRHKKHSMDNYPTVHCLAASAKHLCCQDASHQICVENEA